MREGKFLLFKSKYLSRVLRSKDKRKNSVPAAATMWRHKHNSHTHASAHAHTHKHIYGAYMGGGDEAARAVRDWVITSQERRSTLVIHCGRRRRLHALYIYTLSSAALSRRRIAIYTSAATITTAAAALMVNYKYAIKPCRARVSSSPTVVYPLRAPYRHMICVPAPSSFVAGAQIPRVWCAPPPLL